MKLVAFILSNGTYEKIIKIIKDDNRFKMLSLSRNFGSDGGITAGLNYAKGDAVIIMNADLQDPPELLGQFIKKWEEGNEIVYGNIIAITVPSPEPRTYFLTSIKMIII